MELLKSEGFTAEETFAIICDIDKERAEAAKYSDLMKFIKRLKKERVERRKQNPYEMEGE